MSSQEVRTDIVMGDKFSKTLDALVDTLNKLNTVFDKMTRKHEGHEKKVTSLRKVYKLLQTSFAGTKTSSKIYIKSLDELNAKEVRLIKAQGNLRTALKATKDEQLAVGDRLRKHTEAVIDNARATGEARNKAQMFGIVLTDMVKKQNKLVPQRDRIQKSLTAVTRSLKAAREAQKKLSKTAGRITKVYSKLIPVYRKYRDGLKVGKKINDRLSKSVEKRKDSEKKLIRVTGQALGAMQKTLQIGSAIGKKIPKAYIKVAIAATKAYAKMGGRVLKEIGKGISLIGQQLVKINEGFGRIASGGMRAVAQGLSDILRGGLQRLIKGLGSFGRASLQTFADLELSAKRINIFSGLGLDEAGLGLIRDSMKNLAKTSLFNLQEISVAFEELAAVGVFDTVEQLQAVGQAVIDMATATGETDLQKTAEILVTTMNAFGDSAGNAAQVASILTKIANDSALTVSQIGDAMQYVAATAASANITIEETGTLLGILSNLGFQASRAGTSLNQAMQKMIKPTDTARLTMDNLGLSFFNQAGEMKSFQEIIPELAMSLNQLGTNEEKLATLTELFGIRGGRAMAALVNEYGEANDAMFDMIGTLEELSGKEVGDQATDMMDTLAGSLASLEGAIEALKATFGELLAPAIRQVSQALQLILENQNIKDFFALLGEVVGTLITTLVPLISIIASLLIPILTALIPFITMVGNLFNELFGDTIIGRQIMGALSQIFSVLINVLIQILPIIMELFVMVFSKLLPVFADFITILANLLLPILQEIFKFLMPVLSIILGLLANLFTAIMPLLPLIAELIMVLMEVANAIIMSLAPILVVLVNLIIDNIALIEAIVIILTEFGRILLLLTPLIKLLAFILAVLIAELDPLLKALTWIANAIGNTLSPRVSETTELIDKMTDAFNRLTIELEKGNLKLGLFGKLLLKIKGVSDEMADLADFSTELQGQQIDDPRFLDETAEEFASSLQEEIDDQTPTIPLVDISEWEDIQPLDFAFNPESFDKAQEDVGEFVLSGTSVQDLVDLTALTGINPNLGVEDTGTPAEGGTNIVVENIEIIIEEGAEFSIDELFNELGPRLVQSEDFEKIG